MMLLTFGALLTHQITLDDVERIPIYTQEIQESTPMTNYDLNDDELRRKAVDAFILKVSLPLLTDASERMAVLGTGTLFHINERYFIVTAAHILKEDPDDFSSPDIDLSAIAYPSRLQDAPSSALHPAVSNKLRPGAFKSLRPAPLNTLGPFEVFRLKMPCKTDVAVLELKSSSTIAVLKEGWGFLTLRNVGAPPDDCTDFILAGYLFEGATFKAEIVTQRVFSLQTNLLDYLPEVEFPEPGIDQFYYLPENLEAGNPPQKVTSLNGLSGASIWAYVDFPHNNALWDASLALRVVGVQSSAKMGHWFRGFDWAAVKSILGNDDLGLREAVI